MLKELKTVKDLKELLNEVDETSPIFLGEWNGYTDTYTVADHAIVEKYEQFENDFFGTRGKMDKRLFNGDFEEKDVVYIGSIFHRNVDNADIDTKDDANEPIELINGEQGDHDLFWKSNDFNLFDFGYYKYWLYQNTNFSVKYYPETKILNVVNGKYHWEGECIGIQDFFDIMTACKIDKTWRIG